MAREIQSNDFKDTARSPNSDRVLIIYSPDRDRFESVVVDINSEDALSKFVFSQENEISSEVGRLEHLRRHSKDVDVERKKSHGVTRSDREARDIRESKKVKLTDSLLERQIKEERRKLSALQGDWLLPLEIHRENDDITGFSVKEFESQEEKNIWFQITRSNRVVTMLTEEPESIDWLAKGVKVGAKVLRRKAKREDWMEYVSQQKFDKLEDEHPIFDAFRNIRAIIA